MALRAGTRLAKLLLTVRYALPSLRSLQRAGMFLWCLSRRCTVDRRRLFLGVDAYEPPAQTELLLGPVRAQLRYVQQRSLADSQNRVPRGAGTQFGN